MPTFYKQSYYGAQESYAIELFLARRELFSRGLGSTCMGDIGMQSGLKINEWIF